MLFAWGPKPDHKGAIIQFPPLWVRLLQDPVALNPWRASRTGPLYLDPARQLQDHLKVLRATCTHHSSLLPSAKRTPKKMRLPQRFLIKRGTGTHSHIYRDTHTYTHTVRFQASHLAISFFLVNAILKHVDAIWSSASGTHECVETCLEPISKLPVLASFLPSFQ